MITICNRPALFLLVKPAKHCGFYNSKGEAMPPKQRRGIHEHYQKNAERHGADGRSANFYSRPCERGDRKHRDARKDAAEISTHAPARGATSAHLSRTARMQISTHAPARGATIDGGYDENGHEFLLTPLREGRRGAGMKFYKQITISTHAPARGATGSMRIGTGTSRFLLTPLREGRLSYFPTN